MAAELSNNLTTLAPEAHRALLGATPGQSAATLSRAAARMSPERIDEAAKEFEAVFIAEMLRPMFDQVSTEPPFGGGFGESVWKSMLADEYGKALVQQGGIGLADSIAHELLRAQEAAAGMTGMTGPAAAQPVAPQMSETFPDASPNADPDTDQDAPANVPSNTMADPTRTRLSAAGTDR